VRFCRNDVFDERVEPFSALEMVLLDCMIVIDELVGRMGIGRCNPNHEHDHAAIRIVRRSRGIRA
jgi:hypothetical protein